MAARRAQRGDRELLPLPEQRARLDVCRVYVKREHNRIARGHIPREMEDKWFVFLEADHLYLHRSWTGFCIYEVLLVPGRSGYHIAEAWVNRDPEQYGGTDCQEDASMLTNLIDGLLLGQPVDW